MIYISTTVKTKNGISVAATFNVLDSVIIITQYRLLFFALKTIITMEFLHRYEQREILKEFN
jgi:hypothetical protein